MKKWKLPRLSRGGKVLRNLGAALLLAVLAASACALALVLRKRSMCR